MAGTLISDAIQMGNQEPHYTWIKGMESETDNKFRLIIGKYDSSITNNKLIEISPDKTIRFFGSVIMDKFTMSPGSLNGNAIQNGTISGDKIQSGITITGTLVGKADQAIKDNKGNVIDTFYAPKTELSKYLLKSENAVSATKAIQDGNGNNIVNTYATKTELNAKISKTGNRGTISGYETCGSSNTINQDSPDSNVTGSDITIQDGSDNTSWTKTIRCTASAPVVNLGSKWVWSGGSTPTLKQNGILVCAWLGNEGIVSFISKN